MASPASPADTTNGKKTYEKHCASCHGKEGKGNPALVKLLNVKQGSLSLIERGLLRKTTAEFIELVENGAPKMPAYKDKLSNVEIEDIAAYLSGTARESIPNATSIFKSKCSLCHGLDGRGDRKMAENIGARSAALNLLDEDTLVKKDEALIAAMRDGAKRMPAYKDRLSDEDLKSLVGYIRELAIPKREGR